MSYHCWTTDGFGFCVDDIHTTPARMVKLAEMNERAMNEVQDYLDEFYPERSIFVLSMADFDDLEGDYGETGLAFVLHKVIDLPVTVTSDFDGRWYILYEPCYPWSIPEAEKGRTEDEVREIFQKYIAVLTDEDIYIGYQSVENGG